MDPKFFSDTEKVLIKEYFVKKHPGQWVGSTSEIHMVASGERDLAQNIKEVKQRLLTAIEEALNPPEERNKKIPEIAKKKRKAAGRGAKLAEWKNKKKQPLD
ncbi:MAG: hypothetical protein UX09_C0012G0013 [Candidatus Uhrbacteria bacterium GW2011_GWE2_45_35]|uniref:Prokaryotic-type class I peptide chain release factors domain-containing protein n=2 Tax=Candidatus Uhriibacteriota TaxID=1752732 RepID=A0A0G1JJL8_9BACT|nr:MAG: hypothetical protein UW63_C0013G0006 [Candidatus Uhrbacteria bacterium GW2011_GWF2_44_350]KKU08800.1 MAG: hypothetical protein UX09_C0012G0013 [Candidatus Uhrbacteria bacterium GW2011_GWE2_45_35]